MGELSPTMADILKTLCRGSHLSPQHLLVWLLQEQRPTSLPSTEVALINQLSNLLAGPNGLVRMKKGFPPTLFKTRLPNNEMTYFILHLKARCHLLEANSYLVQLLSVFFSVYEIYRIKFNDALINAIPWVDVWTHLLKEACAPTASLVHSQCINSGKELLVYEPYLDQAKRAEIANALTHRIALQFRSIGNHVNIKEVYGPLLALIEPIRHWFTDKQQEEIIGTIISVAAYIPQTNLILPELTLKDWIKPHNIDCLNATLRPFFTIASLENLDKTVSLFTMFVDFIPEEQRINTINRLFVIAAAEQTSVHNRVHVVSALCKLHRHIPNTKHQILIALLFQLLDHLEPSVLHLGFILELTNVRDWLVSRQVYFNFNKYILRIIDLFRNSTFVHTEAHDIHRLLESFYVCTNETSIRLAIPLLLQTLVRPRLEKEYEVIIIKLLTLYHPHMLPEEVTSFISLLFARLSIDTKHLIQITAFASLCACSASVSPDQLKEMITYAMNEGIDAHPQKPNFAYFKEWQEALIGLAKISEDFRKKIITKLFSGISSYNLWDILHAVKALLTTEDFQTIAAGFSYLTLQTMSSWDKIRDLLPSSMLRSVAENTIEERKADRYTLIRSFQPVEVAQLSHDTVVPYLIGIIHHLARPKDGMIYCIKLVHAYRERLTIEMLKLSTGIKIKEEKVILPTELAEKITRMTM